MPPPRAYRLVQRIIAADRAELLAVARAEAFDCGVVEQDFADRPQHEFIKRAGRALRQWVEASQAFDRIAEKIQADRLRCSSRKQIDDAAAHRELTGLAHRIGADIAVVAEEALQAVERNTPARPQCQHPAFEQMSRRHLLQQRVDGRQQDQRLLLAARREPGQRVDAAARDLAVWRHPVVRQAIPGWKAQHVEFGVEECQCHGEPGHPAVVAADMQPGVAAGFGEEAADRRGVMPLGHAEQCDGAGLFGERAGEFAERDHVARGR